MLYLRCLWWTYCFRNYSGIWANEKAELRAQNEGKVLSDDAKPMMGVELSNIEQAKEIVRPRLFLNFILPVLIIIFVAIGTYIFMGSAKTLEAFMTAVFFLGIVLIIQKLSIKDVFEQEFRE